MKFNTLHILFFMLGLSLYNCRKTSVPPLPTESLSVQDQASLLAAFQASNVTTETEIVDLVIQDFFSPEGTIV